MELRTNLVILNVSALVMRCGVRIQLIQVVVRGTGLSNRTATQARSGHSRTLPSSEGQEVTSRSLKTAFSFVLTALLLLFTMG
jgi:hypothetical protein